MIFTYTGHNYHAITKAWLKSYDETGTMVKSNLLGLYNAGNPSVVTNLGILNTKVSYVEFGLVEANSDGLLRISEIQILGGLKPTPAIYPEGFRLL